MNKKLLPSLLLILCSYAAFADDRADELRAEMWNPGNKHFNVLEVPKKWEGKSAVIMAQLNRYEYRKPVVLNLLRYNEYNHFRIKLNDKNAINKYSEMTYYPNRMDEATGGSVKVYVGFKVIKPGGKEIIVDLADAIKMESESNGRKRSYNKLAIPGLEPGDILDYYICEEATMANSTLIYFFDPVIYKLPREYPVMNHKLQFQAERRCYINLVSLNGAPELKRVTDEANGEQYYSLEGINIEDVEDQRWLFPYRELPSIKFRAAYASGKGMRNFDVLLGEPGIAKSSVSKKEVEEMAATMLATAYDVKFLGKFYKTKKLKGEKDPFEVARQCYYFYRNDFFGQTESSVIQGNGMPDIREMKFTDAFSTFLTSKRIEHDIVMVIPRNISALDNLLMENEIEWLIRVKKGGQFLYLSPFDLNTVPGSISPLLEGTEAYAMDALGKKKLEARKITLPVSTSADNRSDISIQVDLKDLGKAKISVKKNLTGVNKIYEQYVRMDLFDFEAEERSRFKMEEDFYSYPFTKKQYQAMKAAYNSKREGYKADNLKEGLESDYDFKIKDPANLTIEQTGRYDTAPAMIYSFTFDTEDLVKKTGPNYLIDAGKLIEKQTKIEGDELSRKTNVYFENARSFKYKITIEIPKGYAVQGLDKFNFKEESKWGGFTSSAKEENGKIVIETNKHYDTNFVPKEEWPSLVKFLNAAYSFTEQKILLKKK
jgi:hypothetical protein